MHQILELKEGASFKSQVSNDTTWQVIVLRSCYSVYVVINFRVSTEYLQQIIIIINPIWILFLIMF